MNYFDFNGRKSYEFGLTVTGVNIYGAPSRIVDKIHIPYRNGDLLIDTGTYNNIIVSYTVGLVTVAQTRNIADWLLNTSGYATLKDSYNSTEFRKGAYYGDLTYQMSRLYRYGSATLSFDCKPQRYLTSGETTTSIGNNTMMTNPTNYKSQPLLTVTGNGTCTVNGYSITVTDNASDSIIIDCERMQCYRGTTNMNGSVTMPDGWPMLKAGNNLLKKGTVTTLTAQPRWWQL